MQSFAFRVAARTILHLGADLIRTDGVAFYELIKNAFDAGSDLVWVEVMVRIPDELHRALEARIHKCLEADIDEDKKSFELCDLDGFKHEVLSAIDTAAPGAQELKSAVLAAQSWEKIRPVLRDANYIEFKDQGEGMSLETLVDVYLVIGTPARLHQLEEQRERYQVDGTKKGAIVLGEKGVGRLSAMRLGEYLQVTTTCSGEERWNHLNIDWTRFAQDADSFIEDIEFEPFLGEKKEEPSTSGTTIRISGLSSEWTGEKVIEIARDEFSRLVDPFERRTQNRIRLFFNGDRIPIPSFDRILFELAHGKATARYTIESGVPWMRGTFEYNLRGDHREKTFVLSRTDLTSTTRESVDTLRTLGGFKLVFYWYNRLFLTAVESIGKKRQVQNLVNRWSGGIAVYRDGFRVNPYGGKDDDWLDIDRTALASSGYKVNRAQLIGKIDISSMDNPCLVDQTSREGLTNNREKQALVKLLQHVIEQFRAFLNAISKEIHAREPVSIEVVEQRVLNEEQQIRRGLKLLEERYPIISSDTEIVPGIHAAIDRLLELMSDVKEKASEYEAGRSELLNLAGLGLMVEVLAHELNRLTASTLSTLEEADAGLQKSEMESLFEVMKDQLKTLRKRLRVLDPLSTAGRQRKERFDVVDLVDQTLKSHAPRFRRHGIRSQVKAVPRDSTLWIKAVRGMIVQVLENLISNSVYWLKEEKRIDPSFSPLIEVNILSERKQIIFRDNGPGISPERRDEVFLPFVTTKPAGEGKGLGLFISREIAEYHGTSLLLSDERTAHPDKLNTFVFDLAPVRMKKVTKTEPGN